MIDAVGPFIIRFSLLCCELHSTGRFGSGPRAICIDLCVTPAADAAIVTAKWLLPLSLQLPHSAKLRGFDSPDAI